MVYLHESCPNSRWQNGLTTRTAQECAARHSPFSIHHFSSLSPSTKTCIILKTTPLCRTGSKECNKFWRNVVFTQQQVFGQHARVLNVTPGVQHAAVAEFFFCSQILPTRNQHLKNLSLGEDIFASFTQSTTVKLTL
jgi:hypothetical protein